MWTLKGYDRSCKNLGSWSKLRSGALFKFRFQFRFLASISQLIKTVWQCSDWLAKIKGYDRSYDWPLELHSTKLSPSWPGENFMSLFICRIISQSLTIIKTLKRSLEAKVTKKKDVLKKRDSDLFEMLGFAICHHLSCSWNSDESCRRDGLAPRKKTNIKLFEKHQNSLPTCCTNATGWLIEKW